MATLYAANKTIERSITPSTILSPGTFGGTVRCFIDTYTGLGTESASDVIQFGPQLPVGAKILWGVINCVSMGGTPDLGDADDVDRYVDEAADNTATPFTDVLTGLGYEIDGDDDQQLQLTLDAAVTAAGTITVIVFYTVE